MTPWKINLDDVPEEHQKWTWSTGNYERYRRHVSVALGNTSETPHPFDVELTRLPPGARPCPVHSHETDVGVLHRRIGPGRGRP